MATVPQIDHCFVDEPAEMFEVTIGGIEYRLRSISAEEDARINNECRSKMQIDNIPDNKAEAVDFIRSEMLASASTIDVYKMRVLTVAAALGVWNTHGNEGWSADRELTIENVGMLKADVLDFLHEGHQEFFRSDGGGDSQSQSGD